MNQCALLEEEGTIISLQFLPVSIFEISKHLFIPDDLKLSIFSLRSDHSDSFSTRHHGCTNVFGEINEPIKKKP